MVSSPSPKQDTFNPSSISVLFTQQKSWTHFETQVTKPNVMLTCRPMKRHFCETEMPLCTWKGSSTTRGSFIVQDSLAKLLSHMSSFAGEDTIPHPQLSRPSSPKAHAWESVRLAFSIQLLKGTGLDFPVYKNE